MLARYITFAAENRAFLILIKHEVFKYIKYFKRTKSIFFSIGRKITKNKFYFVYRMKSGDFVTKPVRNQTDAYPSSFAPKRFRSLQLAPRIPIFVSFLQK